MKVKPKEVTIPNSMKFNSKSLYQNSFEGVIKEKTESCKRPDSLKINKPWLGDSTYRNGYVSPSQPDIIRDDLSRSSRTTTLDPNFKHQYSTNKIIQKVRTVMSICFQTKENDTTRMKLSQTPYLMR